MTTTNQTVTAETAREYARKRAALAPLKVKRPFVGVPTFSKKAG